MNECAACAVETTGVPSTDANMTDSSGGSLVDVCRSCRKALQRRADRHGDGCVFCGSSAEPSRSTGLLFQRAEGDEWYSVCDTCRALLLTHGTTPQTPRERRGKRGIEPGDRVVDRDADDKHPSQAVVLTLRGAADDVRVPAAGATVADLNPDYPSGAVVADVAFKSELGRAVDQWRNVAPEELYERAAGAALTLFSYPVPRLALVDDRVPWAAAADPLEAFK